jgi:hypothetical protein
VKWFGFEDVGVDEKKVESRAGQSYYLFQVACIISLGLG